MFRQPVWWSQHWAWQSFVPLAPSFVFTPFEPLCTMPRIEEVTFSYGEPLGEIRRETRFRMNEDDIQRWFREEELIVKLARVIQLRYGIPGSLPPKPSLFHFDRAHKTHRVAKRMICISREWFAIWMGYVSYLIAKSASLVPNGQPDNSSPAPDWYNHLLNEHGFSLTWLDGLLLSTVCTFDLSTPRAGIVFQWSEENRHRESINWFSKHHIPLWFIWSNKEEEAISNDPSLAYLRPPNELIQQALTTLFTVPNVPLAGLILQQYYRLGNDPVTNKTIEFLSLQHATSFVFEFTTELFLGQERSLKQIHLRTRESIDADLMALKVSQENRHKAAAENASSFPYDGLLSTRRRAVTGAAWSSPEDVWSSPEDPWPSPEDTWSPVENTWPPVEDTWPPVEAASSSSYHGPLTNVEEKGKTFNHYNDFFAAREMRQKELIKVESPKDRQIRESRARNPGVKNAKVYEWEKTQSSGGREVYKRVKVNKRRNEDVYCYYKPYQRLFNAFSNEWDLCEEFDFGRKDGHESDSDDDFDDGHYPDKFVSQPTTAAPMDTVEPEDTLAAPTSSQDLFEMLCLVYCYIPHSGSYDNVHLKQNCWKAILKFLGFIHNLDQLDVDEPKKTAMMKFFYSLVSGTNVIGTSSTFLSPLQSIWTPVDSSGLHSTPLHSSDLYPKCVFEKDYLWYVSRVWVKVRVRLGFF